MSENPFNNRGVALPNAENTQQTESEEKYSGNPEIKLANSYSEYLDSQGLKTATETLSPDSFKNFLENISIHGNEAIVTRINSEKSEKIDEFLDVHFEYVPGVNCHQIFKGNQVELETEEHEVEDIIFVNQDTGKSFSIKSLLLKKKPIIIDNLLEFKAWGGVEVRIPQLGKNSSPQNPIKRGMWNVYKKIEPLVILHEVGHARQNFDFENAEESVEAERDAWRFGLQCIRKLRNEGLNLIPDLNNTQIVNRLELGLLNYDRKHSENLPKRFSRRMSNSGNENRENNFADNFKHYLKFVGAVLKTAKNDPSLVTDTLLYKRR